jgi:hypothetical protein
MPASEQSFTPIVMSTAETPQAVLAVSRPSHEAFEGPLRPVGVAAMVRSGTGVSRYWMSGYANSDDQARCAIVQLLLNSLPDTKPQLVVWSSNIDALEHVPAARLNGGYRSGKNKKLAFAAYALFDPVEAALRDGRWFLQTFRKGEEPGDFDAAQRLAEKALWIAKERAIEFPVYRADHPDWHMLEVGVTDSPATERNERA